MSTVPDVGLECHLFVQKLVGDHDLGDREQLHDQILAWITKMKSWSGDDFIKGFEPALTEHFVALMTHIGKKDEVLHDVEAHRFQSITSIKQIEDAHDTMLAKFGKQQEDRLRCWKSEKIEMIETKSKNLEVDLKNAQMKIRGCLDLLLDEIQLAHGSGHHHDESDNNDVQMTEMMKELETLIVSGGPVDPVVPKQTLNLGEDAQTPFTQQSAPPGLALEEPNKDQQGTMEQDTPQEAAYKHISTLADGPIKSSLMALCSASCQARKGDDGWLYLYITYK